MRAATEGYYKVQGDERDTLSEKRGLSHQARPNASAEVSTRSSPVHSCSADLTHDYRVTATNDTDEE